MIELTLATTKDNAAHNRDRRGVAETMLPVETAVLVLSTVIEARAFIELYGDPGSSWPNSGGGVWGLSQIGSVG